MNEALRQTGRTTRLVERAMHEAAGGRAVYILVDLRQVAQLERQVHETWQRLWPHRGAHGIRVDVIGAGFDWRALRYPDAHPNCVFLVDHYRLEIEIAAIQREIEARAKLASHLYQFTV